jgi:intracellular sulfur oxidation DsrE/DsrF family protein
MKKKGFKKDDLLAEVTTVPSGATEVLLKQQAGYGYFKP